MNQDVWNKLPADVQQAITDVSVNMEVNLAQGTVDVNKQYKADMEKDSSQKFIMLTDAQAEQWLKAAAEEHKKYLAKADAKGLPATAIYNRAVELGKQIK